MNTEPSFPESESTSSEPGLAVDLWTAVQQTGELDSELARRAIETGRARVVDVRESFEFAAGHLSGAVSIPLSYLQSLPEPDAWIQSQLGTEVVLLVHCAHGIRSQVAAEIFYRWGYRSLALAENYLDLQAAGWGTP